MIFAETWAPNDELPISTECGGTEVLELHIVAGGNIYAVQAYSRLLHKDAPIVVAALFDDRNQEVEIRYLRRQVSSFYERPESILGSVS